MIQERVICTNRRLESPPRLPAPAVYTFRDQSTRCASLFFCSPRFSLFEKLFLFFRFFLCPTHLLSSLSGQAVWSQVVSSLLPPGWFLPSTLIAHRVQQSHCSSIFHRVFLTHALALSARQFEHKKKSPRIHTSMHSGGFELTKLTYTKLEDNLIHTPPGATDSIPLSRGKNRFMPNI